MEASRMPKYDPVVTAVYEAKVAIETTVLPPDPLAGLKTKKGVDLLMYKKELGKQDAEREAKGLDPLPQWGLKINLANLCIGPEHGTTVARSMILNKTVTTLDLSGCDLGEEGGATMGYCLERNSVLRHLILNGNFLGPKAALALSKCIAARITSIETLALACNSVGDEGTIALAEAAKENQVLSFLNLRANNIGDAGGKALLQAMDPEVNTSLISVWVNMNHLSAEVSGALNELMVKKCPKPPETKKKKRRAASPKRK